MTPAPPATDTTAHAPATESPHNVRRRSMLQAMSTTNQLLVSAAGGSRLGHRKSSTRPSIIAGDRIRLRNRRETSQSLQEEEVEEPPPPRPVIFNEEIERLRIKLEDLEKLTAANNEAADSLGEGRTKHWKKVAVRKEIPPHQRKPCMKRVWVLRKAPHTAEPQVPSPLERVGPKFDKNGAMIPYSILGTVEEFYRMNYEKGRQQATAYYENVERLTPVFDRPKSAVQAHIDRSSRDESSSPEELPQRPKSCVFSSSPRKVRLLNRRPKSSIPENDLWAADMLPYWAPRSAFSYYGLPVGGNRRLPSSVLVAAVRPSTARSHCG